MEAQTYLDCIELYSDNDDDCNFFREVKENMRSRYNGWFGRGLLATGMACCLMMALTMVALASTVHVYDQAGVLNASQVQSAAQSLPDPMDIYTTNTYSGTSSSFVQQTRSHITGSNLIVMAIDTTHHYLALEGGSSVPLSNSQYNDAVSAFKNNYNNGDYTGATIAAIHSLGSALGSGSSSNAGVPAPASGLGGIGFGTLCCVGLLVLAAIALFGVFRRRRSGFFGQPQPPMGGPYQQPPYQGYPPNYYGPGYNQGAGMNPWVAGGLGAAAGGLAGYELGRESAENQQQGNNAGNEGNFGGGAEGSFGNGDNFGGGAAGDSGNGGDFGGGGGGAGGDFGGGGSGSF